MYKIYAQSISTAQKTVIEVSEHARLSEAVAIKRKLSDMNFGETCHLYKIYDTNSGQYIKETHYV